MNANITTKKQKDKGRPRWGDLRESEEQQVGNTQTSTPYVKVDESFLHQCLLDAGVEKVIAYKFQPREGQPGKSDKIPIDDRGRNISASAEKAHVSLETAIKRANKYKGGISVSLCFHPDLLCIDIDDCVKDGVVEPWAQEFIDRFGSYTELSPSGKGIHIWVKGITHLDLPKFDRYIGGHKCEFITGGKGYGHVTLTGKCINNMPVADCGELIADIYNDKKEVTPSETLQREKSVLTPEEVKEAAQRGNPALWQRLFVDGDLTKYDGDHSAADFAFVCLLIEAGADEEQVNKIMQESPLYRKKWKDRQDYRERTIAAAFAAVSKTQPDKGVIDEMQERIVWDVADDKIYDLRLPPHTPGTRSAVFSKDPSYGKTRDANGKPINNTKLLLTRQDIQKVHGTDFQPGKDRIIKISTKGYDAVSALNTFHKPTWEPTDDESLIGPFLRMLEIQFPDEIERLIFLCWLKYVVQCNEKRVQWAILHISRKEGLGRGSLTETVQRLISDHNCSNVSLKELVDFQYGDALYRTIYCNVSETKDNTAAGGKFQANDRLRSVITDKRVFLNLKYGKAGTHDIFAGLKFDTNNPDALIIPPTDRRFAIFESFEDPLPPDFWSDYHNKFLPNYEYIRQVYSYLMRIQIPDDIDPCGRAPMTERKRQMISMSRGTIDNLIDNIKADSSIQILLQNDLLLIAYNMFQDEGEGRTMKKATEMVNAALPKNFTKLTEPNGNKKQVTVDSSRPALWVTDVNNISKFQRSMPRKLKPIVEHSRHSLYTMELRQRIAELNTGTLSQEEMEERKRLSDELKNYKVKSFSEIKDTVDSVR